MDVDLQAEGATHIIYFYNDDDDDDDVVRILRYYIGLSLVYISSYTLGITHPPLKRDS